MCCVRRGRGEAEDRVVGAFKLREMAGGNAKEQAVCSRPDPVIGHAALGSGAQRSHGSCLLEEVDGEVQEQTTPGSNTSQIWVSE